MKKIEAIIRKSKFYNVKKALHNIEVNFFSYWDVTGVGNEKEGHVYRGVSYSTSNIQRRYISIVVSDEFEQISLKPGFMKHNGGVLFRDISETEFEDTTWLIKSR